MNNNQYTYNQQDRLYLPGLNGIRAVAALSVLFGHMWQPFGDWGVSSSLTIPWPSGPVTTSFVISGFLITYLLINEVASVMRKQNEILKGIKNGIETIARK